jgi:hypothetical protein
VLAGGLCNRLEEIRCMEATDTLLGIMNQTRPAMLRAQHMYNDLKDGEESRLKL